MTWMQTLTGRKLDLLAPSFTAAQLDAELPEALGKIARFSGHSQGGPYSVAQHCVLGSDHLLRAPGGGRAAALAFLLHDAHEAYIGDITTPVARALDKANLDTHGVSYIGVHLQFLKSRIDDALFQVAGLPLPWPKELHAIVRAIDHRMLATERNWLLGPSPEPWADEIEKAAPIRFAGKLTPWPWHRAADEYRQRLRALLPAQTVAAMAA